MPKKSALIEKPQQNNQNLTLIQQTFINEYLKNGFNGTRAYLKTNPNVTIESANVCASRLLSQVSIKQAIQAHLDKQSISITRPYLTERFMKIADAAEEIMEFTPAISALRNAGELNDLYHKDEGSADKYINVLQQFAIGKVVINQDKQGDEEGLEAGYTIDTTVKDCNESDAGDS